MEGENNNKITISVSLSRSRKKIEKLAKNKDCGTAGKWQQSIMNHLYWSVVSSRCDNADMVKVRWLSLENHIHSKHSGHISYFLIATKQEITEEA